MTNDTQRDSSSEQARRLRQGDKQAASELGQKGGKSRQESSDRSSENR